MAGRTDSQPRRSSPDQEHDGERERGQAQPHPQPLQGLGCERDAPAPDEAGGYGVGIGQPGGTRPEQAQDHQGPPETAKITEAERDYLIAFANQYFKVPISAADIVWAYSGVRPLYDDGAKSASATTRDYVLTLDSDGPALLNVFGGKITTCRRLAEAALAKLSGPLGLAKGPWTAGVPLPGGDFPLAEKPMLIRDLRAAHPFLTQPQATRLICAYGTDAALILGRAPSSEALGRDFGAGLHEAEVRWLMDKAWARRAADVVWRRSKLGLRMTPDQVAALHAWILAEGRA